MSVELLQLLSLVSYISAGVLLLVAVALFFLLGVPKLFGDVTGSNAKKAIESIRQQNEDSGDKAFNPSPVNVSRGKLTDRISPSGNLERRVNDIGVNVGTQKISTTELAPAPTAETTVLENVETSLLNQAETSGQTTILNPNSNEAFSVDVSIEFTEGQEIID
ncbi:MAG: hypothetical protein PHV32_00280 [Eubacteriales bacterium]|nr:hypothetical protein [Eubacteriales bacterium]